MKCPILRQFMIQLERTLLKSRFWGQALYAQEKSLRRIGYVRPDV